MTAVHRDPVAVEVPEPLRTWLGREDHVVSGWENEPPLEELACHPDLVERLTQLARTVRGACRVWVAGRPVVHHPAGAPIAFADGTSRLVVRSGEPAGILASRWRTAGLDAGWVDLDPWAADVAFARATERLRAHVRRAYERAGTW